MNDICSGSVLMDPNIYLDGVNSTGVDRPKGAQAPSNSRLSSFGVERRELGVKGSYADEAEEKLVVVDGHDMDWLHMLLKLSTSNRNSDSYCIVTVVCVV